MVRKTLLFCIFLAGILAFCSMISAEDTILHIKALPQYNYSITVNMLNAGTEDIIGTPIENATDSLGIAHFTFSSASQTIKFSIIARQNGRIVINKKYGNYTTGAVLTLDLFESGSNSNTLATSSIVTPNQTSNASSNNVTNASASNNQLVIQTNSSKSVFSSLNLDWKKAMKYGGYGLGAIILLAIVIFVTIFILKKIKTSSSSSISPFGSKEFNPKKSSTFSKKEDFVLNSTRPSSRIEKELEEAQRKIREAQQTIEDIRGRKQKVIEAERKFEEAKRELERLKDE